MRRSRLSGADSALVLAAAAELECRKARVDSSAFVDLVFGYRSAPFQRRWHEVLTNQRRVVISAPIEHGKTQQITTALPLWWLGNSPGRRGVIVGATASAAQKPFGVIKGLIENPPATLSRVFPELYPEYGSRAKWTDSQIRIAGASATEKDYSLQAVGIEGDILGARFDFAVLDDILNLENTYTAAQREKVTRWILAVLLGRMLQDSIIVLCGNAWFPDDAMHAMAEHGFHVIRDEAYEETEDGQIVPGSILWPEQWPFARLELMRHTLGTVEAWRQLRCKPYAAGEGRFDIRWFDAAFEKGTGLTFVEEYQGPWPTFMGVDLGVQQKEKHDKTAFWVMAVDPVGGTRIPLNAFEERLTGPGIVDRLKDWHRRYGAVIMVENNAAQDFIRQFALDAGIPTRPFTTGKQKADPAFGIPSLGVELEQGLWRLPKEPAILVWRTQCLAYSPGQHVGDLLMASWFAREAARSGGPAIGVSASPDMGSRVDYTRRYARYGNGEGFSAFRRPR